MRFDEQTAADGAGVGGGERADRLRRKPDAQPLQQQGRGLLAQVATPSDLYEFPNSRFVADFVGSVNMFEGVLDKDEPNEAQVRCPELKAPVNS